jgi:hypothetical protein
MAAILPKEAADGVKLAQPIFDHSKIAMIDEMVRAGVPAVNPFFNEAGAPQRLSYYYLWHYSAAVAAILIGVSGWEADAALTWFTAFSSLLVVIGFSIWLGGRGAAGIFAVAIAATASLRPIAEWLLGEQQAHALIRWATGFGGWLSQVSWAPQHVASATLVVVACYLIAQLPNRRDPVLVFTLAVVAAAGFQSSVWAGGVAFAAAAIAIGLKILWETPHRKSFLVSAAVAALVAFVLAAPFLYDQITITAMRDSSWPIMLAPLPVLGEAVPDIVRRLADVPAYWLLYLPVEFPGFYIAGVVALILLLRDPARHEDQRTTLQAFAVLLGCSLLCSWLLIGDLGGNNDLAWRAVLPAILLLICFAAAGLARWLAENRRFWAAAALIALLLGLPEGFLFSKANIAGEPSAAAPDFANSPALWQAVRRHASASERVANNPAFLRDITPWPVNMSWALLADRRSCYAGYNLGIPFAPVPDARRKAIDEQFSRVFEGQTAPEDLQQLAERQGCDVVFVTPRDGAWDRDPFASSSHYRLVESQRNAWRIYRRNVR